MKRYQGKELLRDSEKGKVAGVCAGLANYLGWEVWLVRIVFFTGLVFGSPLFFIAYIAAWLILSKSDKHSFTQEQPTTKKQNEDSAPKYGYKTHDRNQSEYQHHIKGNESIKVKARVWQAGEPPKQAFHDIRIKFESLERKLILIEKHVTSSNFDLAREINKL